ncbi:MAG TPA: (p)ppGpp synthetase [Clostridiales bacterium UBA8153]|nr:(p)ppGpp synthetase [Clostridiales bacterium UBA8153]
MVEDAGALLRRVRDYAREQDVALVERALSYSARAHDGQERASGEPFAQHPLAVAAILAELEMDGVTLAAALLHDVAEDTSITIQDIQGEFGPEVAKLADGVTKLGRLQFSSQAEAQAQNLRRMFMAMAEDLRVVIIKLADRLHNMRTLEHLPEERRRYVARETLDIFAPLAHRLGIWRFKWELEDLAFRYLESSEFYRLAQAIAKQRGQREAEAQVVIDLLKQRLAEAGIRAEVQGRAKNLYSIHHKMVTQDRGISEIYDLIAVRVVTDSAPACYAVLGLAHELWKPIPGRIKDYIAMPKPNGYKSLHTTVIGPEGDPVEIQIRTEEMHRTAEYGVAAHWTYKEGRRPEPPFDQKLAWLRQVLEWQREPGDAGEFLESLKIDLFDDEVFVFTPKGNVIALPAGSTPLDFAYQIHTDVGHRCSGARANGRLIPLDYVLRNGDIVEILTGRQAAGPSLDWLKLVKTSNARSKIRGFFKRQRREENISRGRELLDKELRRLEQDPKELLKDEVVQSVCRRLNFASLDDLLAAIAYGGITAGHVAARLRDSYRAVARPAEDSDLLVVLPPKQRRSDSGVLVHGLDQVLVRFGRCCNPVPGDPIIGYITRGRGVSIHRVDCPNLASHQEDTARLLDVAWEKEPAGRYPVDVTISGLDRAGLLFDVTQVVKDMRCNISEARARRNHEGSATIDLTLEVRDLQELDHLFRRLQRLHDVINVGRAMRKSQR